MVQISHGRHAGWKHLTGRQAGVLLISSVGHWSSHPRHDVGVGRGRHRHIGRTAGPGVARSAGGDGGSRHVGFARTAMQLCNYTAPGKDAT